MFTVEEVTLMKIYSGCKPEREKILKQLNELLPHFMKQEEEMKELTKSVIRKLRIITEKDFSKIDFSSALYVNNQED